MRWGVSLRELITHSMELSAISRPPPPVQQNHSFISQILMTAALMEIGQTTVTRTILSTMVTFAGHQLGL